MSYYSRKVDCYKEIDPLIISGEATEIIIYKASRYGFGPKLVHERMAVLSAYVHSMKKKRAEEKKAAAEKRAKEKEEAAEQRRRDEN